MHSGRNGLKAYFCLMMTLSSGRIKEYIHYGSSSFGVREVKGLKSSRSVLLYERKG